MRAAAPRLSPAGRTGWRHLLAGTVIVTLLVSSRAGQAESVPDPIRGTSACLTWLPGAAAACPSREEIEAGVEEIMGQRVFGARSCDIAVKGTMQGLEHGGWVAELSFVKSSGEALGVRSLQSAHANCAMLKGPAALAIALMVETGEANATLHVPAVAPPPASSSAAMSLSVGLASGMLPELAYGATAALDIAPVRWAPLQLSATFWFPKSSVESGLGGQFWAWHAGAGYCPTLVETKRLAAAVCAGAQAGIIHGTGVGFVFSGAPTKPYGDVDGNAQLSFPLLGPLAAQLRFGVAVPWMRTRFVYLDEARTAVEVHRPHAVVYSASLGLAIRVPRDHQPAMVPQ